MIGRPRYSLLLVVVFGIAVVVGAILLLSERGAFDDSVVNIQRQGDDKTVPPVATLEPVEVLLMSGKRFILQLPTGYGLSVAAQGFRRPRFMAVSPDGRLFVGEMTSASDSGSGRVLVFDDFDEAAGIFKHQQVYLSGLRNPHSVAFYTDPDGVMWLYVALTDQLLRYRYSAGEQEPAGQAQVIARFPATPHSPPEGYWHITRTIVVHDGKLYVSIGSSCNSCEEQEALRAVIVRMQPDGNNQTIVARGLRNAVGLTFRGDALFATVNEADDLGNDRPEDVIYAIETGRDYGWPYCYEYQGKIYDNSSHAWQQDFDCEVVPLAWHSLPAHSAPLGIAYVDGSFADSALQKSFLVALHGSGDVGVGTGNEVVLARQGAPLQTVVGGFLQAGKRVGRPVGILQRDEHSFFITDDLNGVIYFIRFR